MAYENININQPNFCIGPQTGTFCTIDITDLKTYMRVVNTTGSIVMSMNLSSNIASDNVRVEYVGPKNLTGMVDGATFFTFEIVSSTTCMVKRWEANIANMELSLKEQIVKHNSGEVFYNPIDFSVEHHSTTISKPNEKYNYLYVNDTTHIKSGTVLYIGPSSDMSNMYAFEKAIVTNVSSDINGTRVNLSSKLLKEYATGDSVYFYNNVYIMSSMGFGGDDSKGSLIKLNAYTWNIEQIDTKHIYKKVSMCKWCKSLNSIACLVNTNMLFVEPHNSYINSRSMFMNNIESDEYTSFEIYDVAFDEYTVYKLQKKTSLRSSEGYRTLYLWSKYNFHQDTILNYSNIISITSHSSIAIGYSKEITIKGYLFDQYFTGLKNIQITFTKLGDSSSSFLPIDGRVTTNQDGYFTIKYISGSTYNGFTLVTATAQNSSIFTGSTAVCNRMSVLSMVNISNQNTRVFGINNVTTDCYTRQNLQTYKVFIPDTVGSSLPAVSIRCRTYFTNPGGDWGNAVSNTGGSWLPPSEVGVWLPMLYLGEGVQIDSPRSGDGMGFRINADTDIGLISQKNDFSSHQTLKSSLDFLIYTEKPDIGEYVYTTIKHYNAGSSLTFSQLKMSGHNYLMDGSFYDSLITYTKLNQFVFIEEAIPAFWSSKNAIDAYIWLRLRPFAFSIDPSKVRLYIREVNNDYDSGYINVTNYISVSIFNAGSNINGVEVYYEPYENYKYNSRVFVMIEVYDIASPSNKVLVDYWFDIIPDYEAPYLINVYPYIESIDVPIDSVIEFEVVDDGAGVDIDSLELYVNSRLVKGADLNVTMLDNNRYKVIYTPAASFYYGKDYKVLVKIMDKSENKNRLNFSYRFYTEESHRVSITNEVPVKCRAGINRFSNISFMLLPEGESINIDTLRVQVLNKDIESRVLPVIYRLR